MSLKIKLRNIPHCHECFECHEIFKSTLHLKYHRYRVHNPHRPYVCKECHKSFRRVNELQMHSRMHRQEGSFVCEVCDGIYSTRQLLLRHQGTHIHYEGDNECGYCSASFLRLAEAKLHAILVHDDHTLLPVKRSWPKSSLSDSSIFCVRGGEGLKLKLQRKLVTDTQDEQVCGDDLNPGSQATIDSGKGNSDMDEEEGHRTGNGLIRNPTFMPRHLEQKSISAELKMSTGLLEKPKFEITHNRFGSSQLQPGLKSAEFLSKTRFLGNSPVNAVPITIPSFQKPQTLTYSHTFGNKLGFSTAHTADTFNGTVFKSPLQSSLFSTTKFGTPAPMFGPVLGGNPSTAAFGLGLGRPSSYGLMCKMPMHGKESSFGLTNSFGTSFTRESFKDLKSTSPELLFGSREKIEKTIALPGDSESKPFEQYASGEKDCASTNLFAEAMMRAKRPMPRRDSEVLSDESYSCSESESDDSGVSESSHVNGDSISSECLSVQVHSDVANEEKVTVPDKHDLFVQPSPKASISSPLSIHIMPSPQNRSPKRSVHTPSQTPGEMSVQMHLSQESKIKRDSILSAQESSSPVIEHSLCNGYGNGHSSSPDEQIKLQPSSHTDLIIASRSSPALTKSRSSMRKEIQQNHGGSVSPTEIAYHIDLEVPIMSIAVPKVLLRQGNGHCLEMGVRKRRLSSKVNKVPNHIAHMENGLQSPPKRLHAPTKPEMMKKVKLKPKLGPRSYMQRLNGTIYDSDSNTADSPPSSEIFNPIELLKNDSSARTCQQAPYWCRFKENQKYLSYLRRRTFDLIITLFPDARVGGHFCTDTDDVDGLLDNIINVLQGKHVGPGRCVASLPSKRKELKILLCRAPKSTIRTLQRKICKFLRIIYPSMTLDQLQKEGITTLPKLVHKVITENSKM